MDRKSAAVVMSWRTTGEIIKDSASAARTRALEARRARPADPRVPLRRPDQEHDGRRGSEEMPDGRTIGREQDVDEDGRPREQGDGCDIAASGGEGLTADARPDPFHEEDRDRDADDRVV